MDIGLAHEIEAAERQYLCARVENLLRIEGNPYGARVFSNGDAACFYVQATPSPMFNRIYGDNPGEPQAVLSLLKASAAYSTVTPLIGKAPAMQPYAELAGASLEKLKGWTHLQFACAIDNGVANRHPFEIEEVTPQTLAEFAEVHAGGFRTKPELRELSQASFAGHGPDERMKIYVLKAQGQVVAGALMYLADHGVAYLGTAATRKTARGAGYHGALISHRIEQARAHGCRVVAATALANSQSRRNLQRAGLMPSHAQALYRLADT